MKNSRRKLLLITIFLAALLSLSAYASQVPNAHAAEVTAPEKSLSILNDVAGFNMTAYTPFLQSDETSQFLSSTQKEADFTLMSSTGKLRVRCSFIGDHLRQIFISDLSGEPSLDEPTVDALANAKGFLERYQSYTSDSFYGELKSMLDAVNIGENVTKTEGNVQLKVSVVGQSWTDFMWTYVDENGVPAVSKNVVLNSRDGMLKMFLDNWQLYTIASEPMLSSDQAVAIALEAAEDYSWTVENTEKGTVTVSDFKIVEVGDASLCYLNYPDANTARGGDPFTLYPSWYVPLGFDKVYPGCVTGVTVRVWADNDKAFEVSPMVVGGAASLSESPPAVQAQEQALMLPIPIAMIIVVGATSIYFVNKVRILKLKGIHRQLLKLCAISLCLTVSFSPILTIVPPARAYPPDNSKSRIYASMYDQIQQEQWGADAVCDMLQYMFSNAGYNTTNHCGSETTKNTILANTENDEDDFDFVTVFHFGHMYGANRYQGNNGGDSGDYVSYTDIGPLTEGKTFFAWMWTCESAQDWPDCTGLPSAWSNNVNMSNNAYYDPDSSSNCYIGFSWASPTLNNATGSFKDHPGALGMDFITWFYFFAVTYRYTINDALNLASSRVFSASYGSSPLYQGFQTWWPIDYGPGMHKGWYPGTMRVYGNGNLRFGPKGDLEIGAVCWTGQWFEMTCVRLWLDDFYWGYTNFHWLDFEVSSGYYTIEVDDWDTIYSNSPFACFYVNGEFYDDENPTTVYVPEGTETVVAAIYG